MTTFYDFDVFMRSKPVCVAKMGELEFYTHPLISSVLGWIAVDGYSVMQTDLHRLPHKGYEYLTLLNAIRKEGK